MRLRVRTPDRFQGLLFTLAEKGNGRRRRRQHETVRSGQSHIRGHQYAFPSKVSPLPNLFSYWEERSQTFQLKYLIYTGT